MDTKQKKWLWVALLASLCLAPSPLAVKVLSPDFDPFLINAIRFGIAAVIALPWTVRALPALRGPGLRTAVFASLLLAVSATSMVFAISAGPASYAATLQLLTPLVLVWYSRKLVGEKTSRRLMLGFGLAATGAACIALLPIAFAQRGPFVFYPLATLYMAVNVLFYPLGTVEYRRAHELYRLPLKGLLGISALLVAVANLIGWQAAGGATPESVSGTQLAAIVFLGVYVSFVSKVLFVMTYEKVGSAETGIITYFGALLAILLPIVVLGETLSMAVAIGGCLILVGLVTAELHEPERHKHRHIFHNH